MNPRSSPLPQPHSEEWDARLQDWLDGELNTAENAVFEAHLAGCGICQQSLEALEKLDTELVAANPPLHLDKTFDERLFAQIEAVDESKRAEARRRAEQEWQEQMQALSRNWKRALAFVIPGVIAGAALAFAVVAWMDSSGITNNLVAQGTAELGSGSSTMLHFGITGLIGAALGGLVAPWLARLAE